MKAKSSRARAGAMFIKRKKHRRPVASFQYLVEENTFLGGQDFCFYYMYKTNFSGRNNIWGGTKEILGECPPPRGYGPKTLDPKPEQFHFYDGSAALVITILLRFKWRFCLCV